MDMKKIVAVLIFTSLLGANALARHDIREQLYIHLNSQMFISGETIHFAAYCNSRLTGKPSGLSKILYIEIVGKNGPVHQQKVYLEEGRGNSDFFISSLIPSGQYYLVAYTRWMKNFDDYFQCPVLIVNPFETYPNEPTATEPEMDFFPLHNPLVAGTENVVAFKLKAKNPSKFKGRLVGNNGESVSSFGIGRFGLGKLRFTPQKGHTYQVLLENEQGKINFYDLPRVAEEGSFVVYRENGDQLALKCQISGTIQGSLDLTLSRGDVLYQSKVVPNVYHKVPKAVLSDGIFDVQYTDPDGKIVAERSILVANTVLKKQRIANVYGARQSVTVETGLDSGVYSISVRKKITSKVDNHQHAIWSRWLPQILRSPVPLFNYLSDNEIDAEAIMLASTSRLLTSTPRQVSFLPEIREEILTGNISDSAGHPVAGEKVALTFPGKSYQVRIGKSDEQGDFVIPFQSAGSDTEVILTALDFNNKFNIAMDNPFRSKFPDFNYQLPLFDSALVKKIIERSIRIQIENAYFDFAPEKPEPDQPAGEIPFHDIYLLDDYKRFPTLKETFTEFITTANVRGNRDYVIETTYFPGLSQVKYPPLVLLDGIPVSGERAIQLSPYQVESIGVLPNRYFLGSLVADGIVGIKTFDGDYGDFQFDALGNHKKVSIMGVADGNEYSFPDYSEGTYRHEADQRVQLYWDPYFRPWKGNSGFNFYTSDVPGEYEIVIEGFTQKGKPVTKIYSFLVE